MASPPSVEQSMDLGVGQRVICRPKELLLFDRRRRSPTRGSYELDPPVASSEMISAAIVSS
jgi:hypothetical protein